MNRYEIRERGYVGQVWPSSGYDHQFYFYSVSRDAQCEKLFDGVAGDIAEAISSMSAHILFLSSATGDNRDRAGSYDDESVDQRGKVPSAASALVCAHLEDDMEQWNGVGSAAA